ncbi:MAG: helix-turn-helix domain-containing protein [Gemmatimonadaceae bacterium]
MPWLPAGTPAPATVWAAAAAAKTAAVKPTNAPAAHPASALQQTAGEVVRQAFERFGNVSATARALGISRTTVYRHLRERLA